MFCVYFYYNKDNELIYVGKAVDVYRRWQQHQEKWIIEVKNIGVREYSAKADMDIMEHYYITKLEPKYNKALTKNGTTTLKFNDESELVMYDLSKFILKFSSKNQQQKPIITIDKQLAELGTTIINLDDGIVNLFDEETLRLDLDKTIFKYNDFYLISQYNNVPGKYIKKKECGLSYRTNTAIMALFQILNNPSLKNNKNEFGENEISILVPKRNSERLKEKIDLAFSCSALYGLYYRNLNRLCRFGYDYNIFSNAKIRKIAQLNSYECTLSFTRYYYENVEFLEISKSYFRFDLSCIDILNEF